MATRILAAIDDRDAGHATVAYSAEVARKTGASVGVLHVLEYAGPGCGAPMESRDDANLIVERAVFELRMAGIGAEGMVLSALRRSPSALLISVSQQSNADAILLGVNHRSGVGRLFGSGLRERVIRRSSVPVLITPSSFVAEIQGNRADPGTDRRRQDHQEHFR
jgi:nucleotide-binding universal stress UspA family protein